MTAQRATAELITARRRSDTNSSFVFKSSTCYFNSTLHPMITVSAIQCL